jgi:hypothetical protein
MAEVTFEQVQKAARQPLVREAWDAMTPEMRQQFAAACHLEPIGTKRGRPPNPILDIIREAHPQCSRRTHARIRRALTILFDLGTPKDTILKIEALYYRPNGSFNAAGFEAHAEFMLVTGGS